MIWEEILCYFKLDVLNLLQDLKLYLECLTLLKIKIGCQFMQLSQLKIKKKQLFNSMIFIFL
jgi:hypothetical protein